MRWLEKHSGWVLLGVILLAVGLKVVLLAADAFPFNSDEAIVALMAKHILAGERPIFFYGQAYMGALDAYLVALGFAVFGQAVWVIRLVQALLYAATLALTWLVGKRIGGPVAALGAGLLLAIPAVNVTLYTTVSLGGYGEALLAGSLLLLLALSIGGSEMRGAGRLWQWAAFGLLAGLGLWANALSLVFAAPAGMYALTSLWRESNSHQFQRKLGEKGMDVAAKRLLRLTAALAGGLLGALPWLLFAASNGVGALVGELGGSAVDVSGAPWPAQVGSRLANFLLLGLSALFGLRPPWDVRWLALALIPLALAVWGVVLVYFARRLRRGEPSRPAYALLAGVALVLIAAFVLTPFGNDPSGRYFLPLAVVLSLVAGGALASMAHVRWRWRAAGLALLLVFNLIGTMQCALDNPPGITTQFDLTTAIDHRDDQVLIDFLTAQGETRGYSTYWVSYPLAFRSDESLIFVPRLPYHADMRFTPRDDRYPPFDDLVAAAGRTAYITYNHPALDAALRDGFSRLGITWQEAEIGDYRVFYRLPRAVRPQEIGLGEWSQ